MNLQIFKLDLDKAEEPEIKLPTFTGSYKKSREFQKNIYFCFIDYAKDFDCVDHNKLENSERDGNTRPADLPPEKSLCRSRSNILNWAWNNRLVPNWERSTSAYTLSPCLFNLHAEYIMQNARLDEAQAGIKIAGRNINNLRYADDATLVAENEEELESFLMNPKEESEKSGLKQHSKNEDHCIQSHHFMANRWENNGISDRLYFLGLQNYCGQ